MSGKMLSVQYKTDTFKHFYINDLQQDFITCLQRLLPDLSIVVLEKLDWGRSPSAHLEIQASARPDFCIVRSDPPPV
jgi:hypothetical protein